MSSPGQPFPTPSIARRLASMGYEALLLVAIASIATAVFVFTARGIPPAETGRPLLQAFLLSVFAAYFLWCWLRGGQTLAMRAWRIRLIVPGKPAIPPHVALARFVYACVLVGSMWISVAAAFLHRDPLLTFVTLAFTAAGIGWARFDRDGQFLHDRLAGTRLVLIPRDRT